MQVTLRTNATITTFIDLDTRIITSRAYPLDRSLVTNFKYTINETLFSLNPKTLEIRKNLNFHPQEVSNTAYFTTTPLEDNLVIFHDMIIGSLSENIPETHYNEIWESMQCSITGQFSARTDPTSGLISSAGIEQAFDFWAQAKQIFDIVFFIWTLTQNTALTVAAGLAILCGIAHFYLGPRLISLRNTHKPPTPEHLPSKPTPSPPIPSPKTR
uniref:Uncharacterized protein n=1 Tax=Caenorhabditis japonica TaxID=281687 RepID=A0A8R1EUZ1_CAEJA